MSPDQSLEARIAALEAKDEIRQLTARYCHAVVDGDVEAVVGLFCPDGTFRMRSFSATGTDDLRAMYTDGIGARTHKPFIQNHVIDLESRDEATGRCSVEIRIFAEGEARTGAGHYLDHYRRHEGRWRFAERFYHAYHLAPWATGWTR